MSLYNTGIWLFNLAVAVASLFNRKARLWVAGRRGLFRRLRSAMGDGERIIWIHAASLGEFEQGRPIIEALRSDYPQFKILLTFFSPSGYEVRKDYPGADYIFYLPVDTARNARRFVSIVRPEITIFIKYEFWLNYLRELKRAGSRTFIVSAIFRRDSVFFKWYGRHFCRALASFEHLFVQNDNSRNLLLELGIDNVTVAGDTRFDRVAAIATAAVRNQIVERFASGARVVIAGSTWPQDEDVLLPIIVKHKELKFIIAPHEIGQARIAELVERTGGVRYTECTANTSFEQSRVLIIDTIGILSTLYQYGWCSYIGGGFSAGIHNTLEAVAFGLPVAFGPNYHKFKEAPEMTQEGIATVVESVSGLNEWITGLEHDQQRYRNLSAAASEYVARNTGATELIVKKIMD